MYYYVHVMCWLSDLFYDLRNVAIASYLFRLLCVCVYVLVMLCKFVSN